MKLFESVSQSVSKSISQQLGYTKDQQEVIAYGIFGLLHNTWTISLVLLAAYITNLFMPIVVLLTVAAILRSFSGGAHCTSSNRCAIASILIFVILGFVVELIVVYVNSMYYYLYLLFCFSTVVFIIKKYCPIDSPNKPIKKNNTRKRLQKNSFYTIWFFITIVLALEIIAFFYSTFEVHMFNVAIGTGLIWQSFTLTPSGLTLINWLDNVLKYITK